MQMDAKGITAALRGKWQGRYPAHADRTPSLKINDDLLCTDAAARLSRGAHWPRGARASISAAPSSSVLKTAPPTPSGRASKLLVPT
jgi:hypothetical protein